MLSVYNEKNPKKFKEFFISGPIAKGALSDECICYTDDTGYDYTSIIEDFDANRPEPNIKVMVKAIRRAVLEIDGYVKRRIEELKSS